MQMLSPLRPQVNEEADKEREATQTLAVERLQAQLKALEVRGKEVSGRSPCSKGRLASLLKPNHLDRTNLCTGGRGRRCCRA